GNVTRSTAGTVAQTPGSWSSAANAISFIQGTASGTTGIWVLPMEGERKPRLFLESRFSLSHAEFSPDGRLMAYVSAESGNPEVYVQSYPDPGERTQVSAAGGFEPIWSSNGRELFYRNNNTTGTQQYFSAAIRSLSPFRVDAPRLLFEARLGHTYLSTGPMRSWDVSPDGTRFFLGRVRESTDKPVTTMQVVLNWGEELKRLVPSKGSP
ncbi:MAG TPA: hypothetical protein VNZ26_07560, partial [Vicinamibacterales bacterium]|nr:hypothetical protein [Vicinamibacterales bacterium]